MTTDGTSAIPTEEGAVGVGGDAGDAVVVLDGRWRLGPVIGRGAVADVHAGSDVRTGRPVAVKVLRSVGDAAIRQIEREVAALEELEHPNLVGSLDHGRCPDGRLYLVLERCGGGSLREAIDNHRLGPEAAAVLGAQVARGLAHAHGAGIVHRDVKPANILLDDAGTAKLADFGIARLAEGATMSTTGWSVGTPRYLAPEQVLGEPAGPAADVYALGLVILEAVAGEAVFPGPPMAAALARVEGSVPVPDSVPAPLAEVLSSMTARDPGERPSASVAAAELARAGRATAEARVEGDGTTVFPVASTDTVRFPVAVPIGLSAAASAGAATDVATGAVTGSTDPATSPATAPAPVPTAARTSVRTRQRRLAGALVCFALGFLAVVLLQAGLGDDPDPAVSTDTSVTSVTTVTTAPPTTAPTTAAPPEEGRDRDKPGRGRGRDEDD